MSSDHSIEKEERIRFGFLDILRVLGGLLVINSIFSWWFTSSTTWGYDGKWLDTNYLKLKITNNYVNLTINELAIYNGSDSSLPIYVGVNGKVYDVSANRMVYGPKGSYFRLSGKDAARVFVNGCLMNREQYTYDLRGLDDTDNMLMISKWQSYFANHPKYWFVGYVNHDKLDGDPPPPCEHMSYPGALS